MRHALTVKNVGCARDTMHLGGKFFRVESQTNRCRIVQERNDNQSVFLYPRENVTVESLQQREAHMKHYRILPSTSP